MKVVQVDSAALWLVFPEQDDVPQDVVEEIRQAPETRSLPEVLTLLVTFAVSGIIGNAAWSLFPRTAAYIRGLHQSHKDIAVLTARDAALVVREAANAIVGDDVAIETQSITQLSDGTWQIRLAVAKDLVLVHISSRGAVIAWQTIGSRHTTLS